MENTGRITRAIIENIREKGDDGIDEFVRYYGPKLLVFINYKLGDKLRAKVDPEDVLQDFFASLTENRNGFLDKVDDRGVHRTVFRMLENRIKDLYEWFFKTQKRDGNKEIRERATSSSTSAGFSFSQVAGRTNSTRKIETIDEYKSLEKILSHLERNEQRLFVMKFIEELTNQEMAEEMGISVSTVKRHTTELMQTIQRVRKSI